MASASAVAVAIVALLAAPGLAATAAEEYHSDRVHRTHVVATGATVPRADPVLVNGTIDHLVGYGNLTLTFVESGESFLYNWTRVHDVPFYPPTLSPALRIDRVHHAGPEFRLDGRWVNTISPPTFGLNYWERVGPASLTGTIGGRSVALDGLVVRSYN